MAASQRLDTPDEAKKDLILRVASLVKTLPSGEARALSSCSFSVEEDRLEQGVCTGYGACRFIGQDYMNQVQQRVQILYHRYHITGGLL